MRTASTIRQFEMLGYEFIFPSPALLELRRKQLDDAGFQAWLSPIVLLATIYVGRTMLARSVLDAGNVTPKSPSALQVFSRRVSWILNTTYLSEFGPLNVQLTGILYLGWLLFLIFRHTGHDYLHLTKAFGHVAVSQLPLHYLLAFKTPRSPVTLATGLTHERLNAYHRLFGRIVHGLLATHAMLYVNFFVAKDLLSKRIQDKDVRLGIIAFWLVNVLGLLALPTMRKKAYHKLFYQSHVIISALVPLALFFHVPYTKRYVLQAGVFWLANGLFRSYTSGSTHMRCEAVKDTSLIKVTLTFDKSLPFADWVPGQHLYLRRGLLGPRNPFTIVEINDSSEKRERKLSLIARDLSGPQTGALAQTAATRSAEEISIEGPYGDASHYVPRLAALGKRAGQTVLFTGGVGATYALPIYLHMLGARGDTAGLSLIWFVKKRAEARWGVDLLGNSSQTPDVEIYVTQRVQTEETKLQAVKGINITDLTPRPNMTTLVDDVMIPMANRGSNGSLFSNSKRDPRKVKRSHEKVTMLVCGPPSLSHNLRYAVGKHVIGYGRQVDWFEEQFGLGGS
jgi:NAD(P)H-flavin reductase